MNDSELDQLLKMADTPMPSPTGFQRDVWFRIEAAENNGWRPRASRIMERFLAIFALPSVAVATCTAMVAVGAWFGLNTGNPERTGKMAYVQAISPFAHNHQ